MADLIRLGVLNFGVILSLMTVLWLISVIKRDASIVDPFWGSGFIVVAWVTAAWQDFTGPRTLLLAGLTTVWGLRLTIHLFLRGMHAGEDSRYRAMREKHGGAFWWVSLFTVFGFQGVIMWVVSWPLQFGSATVIPSLASLWWLDGIGIVIWVVGFMFESVGDYQLARFRSDPANRGSVLDQGFWRYTRHPNYFGDFCVWWGLYFIAAAGGAWWTLPAPLLMSILLMKISGVTLLEKTISGRRPGYASYIARTSAFFPRPPKQNVRQ